MILDSLAQQARYRGLHPGFAVAFDWLLKFDPATPDGRIAIDGERVFALVQSYATAPAAEKRIETHREHIDIQYVARGTEIMLWAPSAGLKVTAPYDPAKDVIFYENPPAPVAVRCAPGSVTIFFPPDAHTGGCLDGAPVPIKKVVVKVKV